MYCRLYQFSLQTRIPGGSLKQDCSTECPYYNDGQCSLVSLKNKKMDKEKFGSILEKTLKLPDEFPKYFGLTLLSAVLIIHPRNDDMWVIKAQKNDGKIVFKYIMLGGRFSDAQNLDDLHNKIHKWVHEPLTMDDFELCNSNAHPA